MEQLPIESVPLELLLQSGGGLDRFRFALGDLEPLKRSIRDEDGLVRPPIIWKTTPRGKEWKPADADRTIYVVLDGCRRVAALQELAAEWRASPAKGPFPLETVNCTVYLGRLVDAQQFRSQLQIGGPRGLPPTIGDAAVAVHELLKACETQTQAADLLDRSQPWVSTLDGLTELAPAALDALRAGHIAKADAIRLVRLGERAQAAELAKLLASRQPTSHAWLDDE